MQSIQERRRFLKSLIPLMSSDPNLSDIDKLVQSVSTLDRTCEYLPTLGEKGAALFLSRVFNSVLQVQMSWNDYTEKGFVPRDKARIDEYKRLLSLSSELSKALELLDKEKVDFDCPLDSPARRQGKQFFPTEKRTDKKGRPVAFFQASKFIASLQQQTEVAANLFSDASVYLEEARPYHKKKYQLSVARECVRQTILISREFFDQSLVEMCVEIVTALMDGDLALDAQSILATLNRKNK